MRVSRDLRALRDWVALAFMRRQILVVDSRSVGQITRTAGSAIDSCK
jgi:hypothetical protein